MRNSIVHVLIAFLALLCLSPAAEAGVLYAIRESGNGLDRINPDSPSVTAIGLLGVGFDVGGLVAAHSGNAYSAANHQSHAASLYAGQRPGCGRAGRAGAVASPWGTLLIKVRSYGRVLRLLSDKGGSQWCS